MRDVAVILDAVEPVVAALGLELYDVEVAGTGRALVSACSSTVRVASTSTPSVPRPRPSRRCSTVTQVARALPGAYALEVSSPGLERPLRRPDHYRRAVGDTISVKTPTAGACAASWSRPATRTSSWRSKTARTNESPTPMSPRLARSSSGERRRWHGNEFRDDGGAREHRAREGHLDRDHARGARERAAHRVQAHARRGRRGAGRDRHGDRRHQGDRAGARRRRQRHARVGRHARPTSVASPRRPPSR